MNGVSSSLCSQPSPQGRQPWRVVVADPAAVCRQRLCAFLEAQPAFEVVGQCDHGSTVVALVQRLAPDLVLLDLNLPGLRAGALVSQLSRTGAGLKVFLMTVDATPEAQRLAQACGAAGLLDKHRLPQQLAAALA